MTQQTTPARDAERGRRAPRELLARWVRVWIGTAVGVLTAAVELLFLVTTGVVMVAVMAYPGARPAAVAGLHRRARHLTDMEKRRLVRFSSGAHAPSPGDSAAVSGNRTLGYLAARVLAGILGAVTIGLLAIGAILAFIVLRGVARGETSLSDLLLSLLIGAALLGLGLQAVSNVAAFDRYLAYVFLEQNARDVLERRVDELATSRAEVIAAVDAERQRIERDLHDGLQQRLVALGMLLGRARRSQDPDKVLDLVGQAHDDAQRAIEELRDASWRVYPSALEHSTLDEVLGMVSRRSAVPVEITYDLPARPERRVETVLYFVACEAITNAAKHAGASLITVDIRRRENVVEMRVTDDGAGGADPSGSGLRGLARRVEALDGAFDVHSPLAGPTILRAELPCE